MSDSSPDAWLRQGQTFESQGRFADAVACYDRARAAFGPATSPDAIHALGIICMNRGSALGRLGGAENLSAALAAYDEAIALQRRAGKTGDPAAIISLAAALMNRGQLLHRLHGAARADEALAAAAESESLLRSTLAQIDHPAVHRNLAGTLVNRANLLLDLRRPAEAAADARAALDLVAAQAGTEFADAHLSLLARRCLCDALGQLLVAPGFDQNVIADEASDVVDAALAHAREWIDRGATGFQPLALRLFHFGAQLYRIRQPHFLAEFLRENLGAITSNAQFRQIALENIEAALAAPASNRFLTADDPASERLLQTARDLRLLRSELGA